MPSTTSDTKKAMVSVTPLISVLPKETMAPMPELKENSVMWRPKGGVGSVTVAHKGSPGVAHLQSIFSPQNDGNHARGEGTCCAFETWGILGVFCQPKTSNGDCGLTTHDQVNQLVGISLDIL